MKHDVHKSMIDLLIRLIGVAVLYYLTGRAGMLAATDGGVVTPIWPPSGLALVAILTMGYRMAFGIAAGSFVMNLTVGLPPLVALAIAIGNNAEYIGGAFLLRRLAGFHLSLDRPRDVLALMFLGAGLATTFSAIPGLIVLTVSGIEPGGHVGWSFLRWWLGGMTGVLVVAPLLLVLLPSSRPKFALRPAIEGGILLLLLLAVWTLIFDIETPSGHGYYPAILAVFPFTIWGALRFGLSGATLVNLVNASCGIWGSAHGTGPFAGDSPSDSLVRWCLFTNAVAMTGLFLASASTENRRAQLALKQSHDELEQRVAERTAALAEINEGLKREVAERKRLEAELLQADEEQQRKIGMELHDGLGQHLTSIAFFGATLRQRLEEKSLPETEAAQRIVGLINQSIEMVRALAQGLYPSSLKSDGLVTALKQLAETTCVLKGISCEVLAVPDIDIDDPLIAINLYRVAQEAVNNAVRHGRAKRVAIGLRLIKDQYRLAITDDGIGFDPSRNVRGLANEGAGMGLRNFYYRASLLGGHLRIDSELGKGTTIVVICPAKR
ncbi:MAG TPA: MASE1 domain-containing protein [Rhodocyclaceae bacterium]|nr:MASE1 domain-containing protein [Rhodocyclaceae bacterium]